MNEKVYYAGCNYYYLDDDRTKAGSMHDCEGCEYSAECRMKRETDEWEFNAQVEAEIDAEGLRLRQLFRG
jgi:hypothetical protein